MPAEQPLRLKSGGFLLEAWYAPGSHAVSVQPPSQPVVRPTRAVSEANRGRMAAVIAPPHPEYGGRLDNPVVEQLHAALQSVGAATLRFNFRGSGESEGRASGDSDAADADYTAALSALRERHPGPYIAAGYSFGSAAALRVACAQSCIERALLVAPPLPMVTRELFERFPGPTHVFIGDDDMFSPLPQLEAMLQGLPQVRLRVLAGVDHFFARGGLAELSGLVEAALEHCG